MRIVLVIAVGVCLAVSGFGVRLVVEQGRDVSAFSARTTATVLDKRMQRHDRGPRIDESRYAYEPVVRFRYEIEGETFTSDRVFPQPMRAGGNLGRRAAKAPLDRFEVGEQTIAWYDPDDPSRACLLRRPSVLPYLVILAPVIVASVLVTFLWRSSPPGDPSVKQRKGQWITVLWLGTGIASAGQYLSVAGSDFSGAALAMFGLYLQAGLVPLAFALPPAHLALVYERIKAAIAFSLVGTFLGLWAGLLVGWLAQVLFSATPTTFLRCWGLGMVIPATLFFVIGLISGKIEDTTRKGRRRRRKAASGTNHRTGAASGARATAPSPQGPAPYAVDARPLPDSQDVETLLPLDVGPFRRAPLGDAGDAEDAPIYATYRSDHGEVFVELGVCPDSEAARQGVETSKAEVEAGSPDPGSVVSLDTEPSFFKASTDHGAFMSWSRGRYYFSADARTGEADLDRFMAAFPY